MLSVKRSHLEKVLFTVNALSVDCLFVSVWGRTTELLQVPERVLHAATLVQTVGDQTPKLWGGWRRGGPGPDFRVQEKRGARSIRS